MQLNEILEENSTKAISKKTNISENNVEALVAGDFETLKKVKTLGFISIIEREYNVDLTEFKKEALDFYVQNNREESITLNAPQRIEEKKGRSIWLILLILGLLGYASWYFFTKFDKKQISELLPFTEEIMDKMNIL